MHGAARSVSRLFCFPVHSAGRPAIDHRSGTAGRSRGRRFPFVQEVENVLGSHGAGGFKFSTLLAEQEFAIGSKDGYGRDATIKRNIVFLGDVEVFVHLTDIHMDDQKGLVEGRGDFGAVEGLVKNMAIETPVAAKDHQKTFVGSSCGRES